MTEKVDRSSEPESIKNLKAFTDINDFEVVTIDGFSDVGLNFVIPKLEKLDVEEAGGYKWYVVHPANLWLLQNFQGSHALINSIEYNGLSYDDPVKVRADKIIIRGSVSPLMKPNLECLLVGGQLTVMGRDGKTPEQKTRDGIFKGFDKHRDKAKGLESGSKPKKQIQV